jgi:hypothetical protein
VLNVVVSILAFAGVSWAPIVRPAHSALSDCASSVGGSSYGVGHSIAAVIEHGFSGSMFPISVKLTVTGVSELRFEKGDLECSMCVCGIANGAKCCGVVGADEAAGSDESERVLRSTGSGMLAETSASLSL